jgi:putative phosphoesterase
LKASGGAKEKKSTKIGIVSDTHGYFDPALTEIFAGVEQILHAGDVGSAEVLDELRLIAPVQAVKGNVDAPELGLPLSLSWTACGLQVEMIHVLPAAQSELESWAQSTIANPRQSSKRQAFLRSFNPATRLVIFGHSHEPCLEKLEGMAFLNPGSAGKKRFSLPRCCGLMHFANKRIVSLTIIRLEGYNRPVIKQTFLRLGD